MACGCGNCQILYDGTLTFFSGETLDKIQELQRTSDLYPKPVFLGWYTRSDWDGHGALCLYKCRSCGQVQRAFACYDETDARPYVHFHCTLCPDEENINTDQDLYEHMGLLMPPLGFEGFVQRLREPICSRVSG